nr:MAG TPA: hypothetical protein [Caudoviricetes sp.]
MVVVSLDFLICPFLSLHQKFSNTSLKPLIWGIPSIQETEFCITNPSNSADSLFKFLLSVHIES